MSLLLDTQVILWWLLDDPKLPHDLATRLDLEPDVYYSPVSVWEVTIKQAARRMSWPAEVAEEIRDSEFVELPVTVSHAMDAGRLPLIHNDPFDRMLVAQARCEGLTLVSADSVLRKYDVELLAI